jgi:hypothetical protein
VCGCPPAGSSYIALHASQAQKGTEEESFVDPAHDLPLALIFSATAAAMRAARCSLSRVMVRSVYGLGKDRPLAVEAIPGHSYVAVGQKVGFDDGFEGGF